MNDKDIEQVRFRLRNLRETHQQLATEALKADHHYELTNKAGSLRALLGEDFEELGADLIYATGPLGKEEYRRKLVSLMLEIFRECGR